MSGAGRQIGRVRALIDYDWPVHDRHDGAASRAMLAEISATCLQFSADVENTYFFYPIRGDSKP